MSPYYFILYILKRIFNHNNHNACTIFCDIQNSWESFDIQRVKINLKYINEIYHVIYHLILSILPEKKTKKKRNRAIKTKKGSTVFETLTV